MEFIVTFCIISALLFLLFCAGALAVYLFRGGVTLAAAIGTGFSWLTDAFSHGKDAGQQHKGNGIVTVVVFLVIYIAIVALIANVW